MSMTDPYFVVKDEVNKALNHTKALFQHWQTLNSERQASSPDEIQRTTADLRNCIKSIEWDLEDLEDTIDKTYSRPRKRNIISESFKQIGIVEKNPSRFRINPNELVERQNFVHETKREIENIRGNVMGVIGSQKIDQATPSKQSIGQAACRPLRDTLRNISAGYVPIPTKGDPYEERPSEKKTGNEAKLGKKVSRDESFVLESKDSPSQQDDSPIHQNHVADFELLESDEQALMQAGLAENAIGTNSGSQRTSRGRSLFRIKFRGGHFHRIIAGVFAVITVVIISILLYVFL